MTLFELWQQQNTNVRQALMSCKVDCKSSGCPNEKKDNSFCDHFWRIYSKLSKDTETLYAATK
jgi:hypothetical protein